MAAPSAVITTGIASVTSTGSREVVATPTPCPPTEAKAALPPLMPCSSDGEPTTTTGAKSRDCDITLQALKEAAPPQFRGGCLPKDFALREDTTSRFPLAGKALLRPLSVDSETLGQLDGSQPVARYPVVPQDTGSLGNLDKSSWADDVDYIYEHGAEANCNYPWYRPSFDEPLQALMA